MDSFGEDSSTKEFLVFGQFIKGLPQAGEGDDCRSPARFAEDKIQLRNLQIVVHNTQDFFIRGTPLMPEDGG
jgi:hypothetical protein